MANLKKLIQVKLFKTMYENVILGTNTNTNAYTNTPSNYTNNDLAFI